MTKDERQNVTGNSPNIPQRYWWDNPASTLSQPPKPHHDEEQYPWWRRDDPASARRVDHGYLLLTMTPVPTPTYPPHACTSSPPPNMRSTLLHESPYCTAQSNCSMTECRGYQGSSEWDMGVRCWRLGGAVSCILRYSREHCGCGVLLCAVYTGPGSIYSTRGCIRVLHSHYFTILGWVQPICRRDEGNLPASWQLGLSFALVIPQFQGGLLNDYYILSTKSSEIGWLTSWKFSFCLTSLP